MEERRRFWPFLLLIPLAVAAIAGWFLLPETLVVQIGVDGQPSNYMPKPVGLFLPLAVGTVGAWMASGKEKEKHLSGFIVLIAAAVIAGFTFVFNL